MIWIGTSGWVYPHWAGRFYPAHLPAREQLSYYARHFPTVEINRSFYRLPTCEQFRAWSEQMRSHPGFRFAVKASRYLTHLKKLLHAEEGITRLMDAAAGLGDQLGPFLYQLPPRWHANVPRLEEFLHALPPTRQAAFEFRDPSWFEPACVQALTRIFEQTSYATLAIAVGGSSPTPLDLPIRGSFGYLRFHHGKTDPNFSETELAFWAERLAQEAEKGREVYAYFNNDAQAYAIHNALRLRELLGAHAIQPD